MAKQSWFCTVCGYVHIAGEPPECCPVCGVDKGHFDVKEDAAAVAEQPPAKAWRCLACYYTAHGDAPPDNCPVCGSCADHFEPVAEAQEAGRPVDAQQRIVIVGAGISGISAAQAARQAAPNAKISVISREQDLPYYRLNLTRYLAGELNAEQLQIHPAQWYDDNRIELLLDCEVESIDLANKKLGIRGQAGIGYDKLILSTGAHSFIPPVEGAGLVNVQGLRTRQDAQHICRLAGPGTRCVVIGGGVLGLETAAALTRRGTEVTLIEGFDWLLPRQLNRPGGQWLAGHVEDLGIRLICGGRVERLTGNGRVEGVLMGSGEVLAADLVIFAAGVRCNSALARQADLEVNNGILVDNTLRTSNPDIFAVGDVAEHQGVIYGTWLPAQSQGRSAGLNAAGGEARFNGLPQSHNLKVLDVDLFSIGQVAPEDGSYRLFEEQGDDRYAWFVFRNGQLVGAILLGDTGLASRIKQLIENRTSCSELLDGAQNGADIRQRLLAGT